MKKIAIMLVGMLFLLGCGMDAQIDLSDNYNGPFVISNLTPTLIHLQQAHNNVMFDIQGAKGDITVWASLYDSTHTAYGDGHQTFPNPTNISCYSFALDISSNFTISSMTYTTGTFSVFVTTATGTSNTLTGTWVK